MDKTKVMVVDDSLVFRSQIRNCLEEIDTIEVVHLAKNGEVALDYLRDNQVDLLTLDLEMPKLDGLGVLAAMADMDQRPKVLVFSANTTKGAQKTLEALRLGAVDVVCKPSQDPGGKQSVKERIAEELLPKITPFLGLADRENAAPAETRGSEKPVNVFCPAAVIIGSSTGGPVALEHLLGQLPSRLDCPILIAQHMPPLFTASLAKRLAVVTGKPVEEAKHGEMIKRGTIYIAPGDYHLEVTASDSGEIFSLSQKEKRNSVRPAVDYLFESAAQVWENRVLSFILTGMGSDGKDGCKAVMQQGGTVIIQDKESSVVWGMPGAVYASGDYHQVLPLASCAQLLTQFLSPVRQSA